MGIQDELQISCACNDAKLGKNVGVAHGCTRSNLKNQQTKNVLHTALINNSLHFRSKTKCGTYLPWIICI